MDVQARPQGCDLLSGGYVVGQSLDDEVPEEPAGLGHASASCDHLDGTDDPLGARGLVQIVSVDGTAVLGQDRRFAVSAADRADAPAVEFLVQALGHARAGGEQVAVGGECCRPIQPGGHLRDAEPLCLTGQLLALGPEAEQGAGGSSRTVLAVGDGGGMVGHQTLLIPILHMADSAELWVGLPSAPSGTSTDRIQTDCMRGGPQTRPAFTDAVRTAWAVIHADDQVPAWIAGCASPRPGCFP
ncbi:hypothetical protein [Streptomyces sp. NPDC046727]|uniref:hypothetical protein n=1 Tax=Streptomyces sp. NPDC046727 TaxID=3155373 RepID=UPI0033CB7E59